MTEGLVVRGPVIVRMLVVVVVMGLSMSRIIIIIGKRRVMVKETPTQTQS